MTDHATLSARQPDTQGPIYRHVRYDEVVTYEFLAREGRYLVDETTAVVRFIIECDSTRTGYEPHTRPARQALDGAASTTAGSGRAGTQVEQRLIRAPFFELFAEAVAHMVEGEDEIWLLENGAERRLYVWERVTRPNR
jgi:hypothetical protein